MSPRAVARMHGDGGGTVVLVVDDPRVALVVESDAASNATAARVLERAGFLVLATRYGWEASGWAVGVLPALDLVVTAFTLPDEDAARMLARIRAVWPGAALVVLVEGAEQEKAAREEFPAAFVLAKPFGTSDLRVALDAVSGGT